MRENMYLSFSKHYEEGGIMFDLAMAEIKKNNIKPVERVNVEKWNGVNFEHCFNIDYLNIPGYTEIIFSKSRPIAKEELKEGISYFVKRDCYVINNSVFTVIKEICL